jgi:hypothetical protein
MITKAKEFAATQIESTMSIGNQAIHNMDTFATHSETIRNIEKRSITILGTIDEKISQGAKSVERFFSNLTNTAVLSCFSGRTTDREGS